MSKSVFLIYGTHKNAFNGPHRDVNIRIKENNSCASTLSIVKFDSNANLVILYFKSLRLPMT